MSHEHDETPPTGGGPAPLGTMPAMLAEKQVRAVGQAAMNHATLRREYEVYRASMRERVSQIKKAVDGLEHLGYEYPDSHKTEIESRVRAALAIMSQQKEELREASFGVQNARGAMLHAEDELKRLL